MRSGQAALLALVRRDPEDLDRQGRHDEARAQRAMQVAVREALLALLRHHDGNLTRAAAELGQGREQIPVLAALVGIDLESEFPGYAAGGRPKKST